MRALVSVWTRARVSNLESAVRGDVVHEAEGAAACSLRDSNGVGVEMAEGVGRQAFRAKLLNDGADDVGAEGNEIRLAHPGYEDREQRPGVCEQKALLAIDPHEVHVPVVLGRARLRERDGTAAEHIEHPRRAAQDH